MIACLVAAYALKFAPGLKSPDAAHIHDGAAAVLHHRDFFAHAQPRAFGIDVHHAVEVGFVDVRQRLRLLLHAGVVDGGIQAAELVANLCESIVHLLRITDIGANEHPFHAGALHSVECISAFDFAARDERHFRAFIGERDRGGQPDAGARSRHHRDFPFEAARRIGFAAAEGFLQKIFHARMLAGLSLWSSTKIPSPGSRICCRARVLHW